MENGTKQTSLMKQALALLIVLGASVALAFYLLAAPDARGTGSDGVGHDAATGTERPRGPHGGWIFTDSDYALELQIFETGVAPQFRVYTYWRGKPLPPDPTSVDVSLERLGQPPQEFDFTANDDYLLGDAVVSEPHSFIVRIAAEYAGRPTASIWNRSKHA